MVLRGSLYPARAIPFLLIERLTSTQKTHYCYDTVYLRKAGTFAGEITVCVVITGLLREGGGASDVMGLQMLCRYGSCGPRDILLNGRLLESGVTAVLERKKDKR